MAEFSICDVCDLEMRPGEKCLDRAPLENRAMAGGVLKPGDTCNDCNAPVEGPHHSACKFLWCAEHDVQFLLCRKLHLS